MNEAKIIAPEPASKNSDYLPNLLNKRTQELILVVIADSTAGFFSGDSQNRSVDEKGNRGQINGNETNCLKIWVNNGNLVNIR
jgi:hypothetical protein